MTENELILGGLNKAMGTSLTRLSLTNSVKGWLLTANAVGGKDDVDRFATLLARADVAYKVGLKGQRWLIQWDSFGLAENTSAFIEAIESAVN